MKVLFIEPYPTEGPSSRYRVEQFVPHLEESGIDCRVRPFASSSFYHILYKRGAVLKKTLHFLWSTFRRFIDLFTVMRSDVVFIHLEAYPFGPPLFEQLVKVLKRKMVYDLDDAIYIRKTSPSNRLVQMLKSPTKVMKIIAMSDHVITCNNYLSDLARKYNPNVTAIHTSVDTDKFTLKFPRSPEKSTLIIGWIGSHSTAPYLEGLRRVFIELGRRYSFELKIIGAGDFDFDLPAVTVNKKDWRLDTEIQEFQSLDIGVYPLPDTEWILGTTGFKTIQYMSVGLPCVASNLGSNRDIVQDGVNGFLADSDDEWIEKLSRLIESSELRRRLGRAGRQTVVEHYSLKANAPRILDILQRIGDE